METRDKSLESQFENIRRDLDGIASEVKEINQESRRLVRILLAVLAVIALGIVAVLAKGFGWL